MMEKQEV